MITHPQVSQQAKSQIEYWEGIETSLKKLDPNKS